ncbi:MAG: SIMPL domain-containing protein [Halieaceae bacterium]|jgi:uncharacterized protein YggE|nr:SIMPL domain-containing protein [Halieaceae bacterium]
MQNSSAERFVSAFPASTGGCAVSARGRRGLRGTGASARQLVAVAVLAIFALLYGGRPVLADSEQMPPRSISVTGSATLRASPDMALLRMAVVEEDLDVERARGRADAAIAAALESLKAAAIADGDIDSSGLRVDPQYRWLENRGERELTGYRVTRSLEVRLLDIDRLGALLVALSGAGINQIDPPLLGLQDEESLFRELLAKAAANARERALVIAATLDESLGRTLSVQTQHAPSPLPQRREMAMMVADAAPAPGGSYQSGDIDLSVHLTASFELVE